MNLPILIDVGLGLALIFLILASLGSLLAELWAAHRKLRHRLLRNTVNHLLGPKLADEFWQHSLILPLFESPPVEEETKGFARLWQLTKSTYHYVRSAGARRADAPAYLDAQLFATVVLDIATGCGARGRIPDDATAWRHAIEETIEELPGANNDLEDHLLALLRQLPAGTADTAAALKTATAKWYEEAMQRASGVYRRKTQKALFFIGCGLALVLNADALRIAHVLYENPVLRDAVANRAAQLHRDRANADGSPVAAAGDSSARQQLQTHTAELRDLAKIGFPLGWAPVWSDNFVSLGSDGKNGKAQPTLGLAAILAKFAGLLVCALAVCLGAPFWFDVLGRLVKLRTSAGSAAEKPKESAATAATAGAVTPASAPSLPGTPAALVASLAPLPSADDALAAPGLEFDVARSAWIAEFADRAYETDPAALRQWLAGHGFELRRQFDAGGTQGFLAISARSAVLAFRGTEKKLEDWITDAKFELVAHGDPAVPGKIHRGFKEALALVTADVDAALDSLQGRRLLLHVTGHSLGAALATLAALRCSGRAATADLLHTLHTFGSPRVGDEAFTAAFAARLRERTYRVVNNEDLVTRVPTRTQGYDHVGALVYIDEAGRLQRDVGYWYRFLNFATNALGDLQAAVKTTVKDHSMRLYCGHLAKAARSPRSS